MNFQPTHCCGIQEITELSSSLTAEEAMASFCSKTFGSGKRARYRTTVSAGSTMYSFYYFTAAVYPENHPDRGHNSRYHTPYGTEFAKLIKEAKLGRVTTLPARTNYAFHPDHKVQIWLWRPGKKNLEAWWALYQEKQAAKLAEAHAKKDAVAAALQAEREKAMKEREKREVAITIPPPAYKYKYVYQDTYQPAGKQWKQADTVHILGNQYEHPPQP
jgi:hypothetical protein